MRTQAELETVIDLFDDLLDGGGLPEETHQLIEAERNELAAELSEMKYACPGCGCKPGDGITETCNHPVGCGYSKAVR